MRTSSAKAKGRRLQDSVRDLILEHYPTLEPDDVQCAIMGQSGQDIKLSPAARRAFPYAIECKNQESLSIWSALEQAESNATETQAPLLVFKRNHSETYVAMKMADFIKIVPKNTL
jgi:hypothetical protein